MGGSSQLQMPINSVAVDTLSSLVRICGLMPGSSVDVQVGM